MKNIVRNFILAVFIVIPTAAFAASQSDDNNLATQKAREDYRAYLEQLKVLSQQYKEVTNQMRDVIKEEGYPVFDENTGDVRISHELPSAPSAFPSDPSVQLQENDRDMTVMLQLPGLQRESLKVSLRDERMLEVKGTRKADGVRVEKQVPLPVMAQEEGQTAKYEDGILTVTIRKAKPSKKEIPVVVG